jgi:hypothetical protein
MCLCVAIVSEVLSASCILAPSSVCDLAICVPCPSCGRNSRLQRNIVALLQVCEASWMCFWLVYVVVSLLSGASLFTGAVWGVVPSPWCRIIFSLHLGMVSRQAKVQSLEADNEVLRTKLLLLKARLSRSHTAIRKGKSYDIPAWAGLQTSQGEVEFK